MRRRPGSMDMQLLTVSSMLLIFGLLMLFSASGIYADQRLNDALFFLKRQLVWSALGVCLMLALSRMDYNRLKEWAWPFLALCMVGLAAVLFGPAVAGARRWIRLGPLGLQPAEPAKVAVILFLADYLDRKRSKMDSLAQGLVVPWTVVGAVLGLMALEPDFGTPALLFGVIIMILYIGGARTRYVLGAACCALPLAAFEMLRYPYRRHRLAHFLAPWEDPQGAGYQLVQSMLAAGSGGWFGRGIGASQLKLMHIPAPHTDFIFPILAEELGFAGSLGVLALFAAFLIRGLRIARAAPNLFGMLLASGITFCIVLQAYFNIAMSIGLLPTKGVPLPFFSFGGSSLVTTLAGVGILLNISRQSRHAA